MKPTKVYRPLGHMLSDDKALATSGEPIWSHIWILIFLISSWPKLVLESFLKNFRYLPFHHSFFKRFGGITMTFNSIFNKYLLDTTSAWWKFIQKRYQNPKLMILFSADFFCLLFLPFFLFFSFFQNVAAKAKNGKRFDQLKLD